MTQPLQGEPFLPHRFGRALLKQGGPGHLASLGLLALLVTLPGFALWGATSNYVTGVALRHAT